MTIQAKAVVGAGYGDEGKGLLTDVLASETPDGIVVRSNGGAQAGHSVVTAAGVRHVFHHVGSGALAGAATHLSRHFIAHPMLFLEEWSALRALGAELRVSSDPRALITTPFDVAINQAVELSRGRARHGSTGVGFGETIERSMQPELALTTQDLYKPDLKLRLGRIAREWMPMRLNVLGVAELPEVLAQVWDEDAIIARFAEDCDAYLDRVVLLPDRRLGTEGNVVFEAAQGLMLDQDYGTFPHVTRSHTGIANMLDIAAEAGIEHLEVTYVTRCYVTRHGAGPLPLEQPRLHNIEVSDPTNLPNAWQGALRLAPLDTRSLRAAISWDLQHAAHVSMRVHAQLAITCLDQAVGPFLIRHRDTDVQLPAALAATTIAEGAALPLVRQCWGATRIHCETVT